MSLVFTQRLHFARALHSNAFALLWTGQTVSALGDGAFVTALSWEALQLTGSATAMGIVVLAQTLPMIPLLLLGGVIADRFPRQQVMLWSDASRAVAVLLIAALGVTHLLQLWHLVLLALFFGTVRGFFSQKHERDHVIVAPYSYPTEGAAGNLPAGTTMALVAWHRLRYCDQPSLAVAFDFVHRFRYDLYQRGAYQGEAPEKFAPI